MLTKFKSLCTYARKLGEHILRSRSSHNNSGSLKISHFYFDLYYICQPHSHLQKVHVSEADVFTSMRGTVITRSRIKTVDTSFESPKDLFNGFKNLVNGGSTPVDL